jgi:Flp pilus assembly pilin Flp
MSNLIHSAQDTLRKQCIEVFVALEAIADRAREQRGQTAAEYMGILFIVAAIIVAIVSMHLDNAIAGRLSKLVTAIGDGVKP